MALTAKDKMLQIRIDQDLLTRFSLIADQRQVAVSVLLRDVMRQYVDHQDKLIEQQRRRVLKDAEWAATQASRSAAARAVEVPQKQSAEPVVAPEGVLARKRRLEKEAKALKMAKRADSY